MYNENNDICCDKCSKVCSRMLMVKNSIWLHICDDRRDFICPDCMEQRLGRKFKKEDVKSNIPANIWWYMEHDMLYKK